MPYAERNDLGEIISLQQFPKTEDDEYIEPSHPDIIAFTKKATRGSPAKQNAIDLVHALAEPDRETTRVSEDLIALLIEKKALAFPDLPAAVQNKLLERKRLRQLIAFGAKSNIFKDYQAAPTPARE